MYERRFGIREYEYLYGYTSAQIDLMLCDQPVISFKQPKKGMGNSAKDVAEMDALTEAWKKKNDSMAGKSFSLDGFMKEKT